MSILRSILLFTTLFCASISSRGQYVSTFFDSTNVTITDDLEFDAQGNLYGADYSGDAVYKITPAGVVSTYVSGMDAPNGIAFDSMGNLFVCDNIGNAVYKVSPAGSFIDTTTIASPSGIIKQEGSDTMIFTTYAGNKLVKLAPDGTMTTWFAGAPLVGPVGLVYDDNGRLYIGNFTNRKIYEVRKDSLIYIATIGGTSSSSLGFITFANNSLWGTNFQNHQIYRVYLGYTDSVVLYAGSTFGSVDGPLSTAKFYQPNGIVAKGDSLYISEYATGNIRLVSGISLEAPNHVFSRPDFNIAPNPVNDLLSLTIQAGRFSRPWFIKDIQGRVIIKGKTQSETETIPVGELPSGVYFLHLESAQGRISAVKFLKS